MKTISKEKAIKNILDWSMYNTPHLKQFHTSWLEDSYEVCCDSHRVLRFYQPISEDLEIRENVVSRFYQPLVNENYVKIELPSVEVFKKEIKDRIGRAYKSKRVGYKLGEGLAVVNAKYLLDLMEFLGTNEIYYNADKPKNAPLLLKSEIGDAILLPIANCGEWEGFQTL